MAILKRIFGFQQNVAPIVVVSGLPRSGTSMLMAMLDAGGIDLVSDGLRTADEDNPKGYYELEKVKELDKTTDTSWLEKIAGKGIKVISFLLEHLPDTYNYKIIFMRRELSEVLASQQKMLERRSEQPSDISDEEMAALFSAHLEKIYKQLSERPNCDVLYIDHREALNSPDKIATRINTFLDNRLDVTAMTKIVDKQLYRNRA